MTAPTELLHRLQIKAGTKLWLINVPEHIAQEITAGAEVEPVTGDSYYDGVLACFNGVGELEATLPRLLAELPPDGLLWVGYPKGGALDWTALEAKGFVAGDEVALDGDWSAVRFQPKESASNQ